MIRACTGLFASSSASTTTLNRRCSGGRSASTLRSAGARSSTVSGSGADAARAISTATSRAVLPLACIAARTLSTLARTATSFEGSAARIAGSAVVTIRPSTADLPTPGEPVTTSTRASGAGRSSHPTIALNAVVRPRNRYPPSLSLLTPRARDRQWRTPSLSRVSVQPQAACACSPAASTTRRSTSAASFCSGRNRSAWKNVSARPSPSSLACPTRPTTAWYCCDHRPAPLNPRSTTYFGAASRRTQPKLRASPTVPLAPLPNGSLSGKPNAHHPLPNRSDGRGRLTGAGATAAGTSDSSSRTATSWRAVSEGRCTSRTRRRTEYEPGSFGNDTHIAGRR